MCLVQNLLQRHLSNDKLCTVCAQEKTKYSTSSPGKKHFSILSVSYHQRWALMNIWPHQTMELLLIVELSGSSTVDAAPASTPPPLMGVESGENSHKGQTEQCPHRDTNRKVLPQAADPPEIFLNISLHAPSELQKVRWAAHLYSYSSSNRTAQLAHIQHIGFTSVNKLHMQDNKHTQKQFEIKMELCGLIKRNNR